MFFVIFISFDPIFLAKLLTSHYLLSLIRSFLYKVESELSICHFIIIAILFQQYYEAVKSVIALAGQLRDFTRFSYQNTDVFLLNQDTDYV